MNNKTVLITGASRGIGAATAIAFAEQGYNIVLSYNTNADAAHRVADSITAMNCNCISIPADVSDQSQVDDMFAAASARFGGVDILVNNAGIAMQKMLCDTSAAEWDALFAVNMRGMFLCAKAAMPYMVAKKEGCIVNVSSVWGMVGASCEVAYSASKAAVIGFTKALAKEAGPSGIRVNCVAPGAIDTDMNIALDEAALSAIADETPLGRMGTPAEVAAVIRFLCGGDAAFMAGQVVSPNGGWVV